MVFFFPKFERSSRPFVRFRSSRLPQPARSVQFRGSGWAPPAAFVRVRSSRNPRERQRLRRSYTINTNDDLAEPNATDQSHPLLWSVERNEKYVPAITGALAAAGGPRADDTGRPHSFAPNKIRASWCLATGDHLASHPGRPGSGQKRKRGERRGERRACGRWRETHTRTWSPPHIAQRAAADTSGLGSAAAAPPSAGSAGRRCSFD